MNLSDYNFAKVMDYPDDPDQLYVFDFSNGYDAEFIRTRKWGIGRYNERRVDMYATPLFGGKRNIHMGIDIWAKAGEPVNSFYNGEVAYADNNNQPGDYGPTIVIAYELNETILYALYGHLSEESLQEISIGEQIKKGEQIADLGDPEVNGGWEPHLHFQLSTEDPGEADMPGVVGEEKRAEALEIYPDPRIVLGDLY